MSEADEWPYEAWETLARVWGFRVRAGEPVTQAGIFYCARCGLTERFEVGETTYVCVHDGEESEWVWCRGDDS